MSKLAIPPRIPEVQLASCDPGAGIETFKFIAEKFLAYQRVRLRARSYRNVLRHIRLAKPLHQMPIAAIDRQAIASLVSEVQRTNGDVTANRVRTTLSHLFRWSLSEGLVNQNPVLGINKLEEKPRDRVLENFEVRAIWHNVDQDQFGAFLSVRPKTS
jgi:site-specific recombinase XerD